MRLVQAQVLNYKSIDDSGTVGIDSKVTAFVGQNEAGKTAFLQALEKARPIRKGVSFSVTEDYPRKALNTYLRKHDDDPAPVVQLTYELEQAEIDAVHEALGAEVLTSPVYSITYKYGGHPSISLETTELPFVAAVVKSSKLPSDLAKKAGSAQSVRELITILEEADLNSEGDEFLAALKVQFKDALASTEENVLAHKVFHLVGQEPEFLYFGDYQMLPGKVNLSALAQRRTDPKQLTEADETVIRLLRMADVDVNDLTAASGYEEAKARLEGLSNSITDQVFEFWTQNKNLEVQIDIQPDPKDPDPAFRAGANLYIRIRNQRHRVTVPFSQRSKGFIWFFSFLVWFDSVMAEGTAAPVILLLDEPGLSLHALAQADLLRYIDNLAERHQVLYTTHSPFMINGDRLHQVRLVEDRLTEGTVVSDNVMGSDPKTVFPLQAALGYTVAQNLFISKRNLLVEGPADLIYLKFLSAKLEDVGRQGLREDITVVPVGGLDKLATFVALLGGNELELAVLHDLASKPDQRLESVVRSKLIHDRQILNYGSYRGIAKGGKGGSATQATDVEDLFTEGEYLALFNLSFAKQLGGVEVTESDLPKGDRIIERLERYIAAQGIAIRPSGGFNHYTPATYLASNPRSVDPKTLDRFEDLFKAVNSLFSR